MFGMLGRAVGGLMGGGSAKKGGSPLSRGLMKPRGPMLTDQAPMTGPAQLSKGPGMSGSRRIAGAFQNRKMTR